MNLLDSERWFRDLLHELLRAAGFIEALARPPF